MRRVPIRAFLPRMPQKRGTGDKMTRKSLTRIMAVLTAGVMMATNIYAASIPVRADSVEEAETGQSTSETADEEAAKDTPADTDAEENEDQPAGVTKDGTEDAVADDQSDDLHEEDASEDEQSGADITAPSADAQIQPMASGTADQTQTDSTAQGETQTQSSLAPASTTVQTTEDAMTAAPARSLLTADETGIQIQYNEKTTIHSITDGDDTLILYCMNNELHWPHTTPTISAVPTYSKTTLEQFCADNHVEDSKDLAAKLKALLYAGYPYNGFGQYQIVDTTADELTEEEYNVLLTPPQYLRDDFPESLGTTVFTLENSMPGTENYKKLVAFSQETYTLYLSGATTSSGLTYSQVKNTDFWKAVYSLVNFGTDAKEFYNATFVSGYYVTDEQAYASTRDAVWNLLYTSGVPYNNLENTEGLTGRLKDAADSGSYTILDSEPTSDKISLDGDLSFYYNETDGKWHTWPITISVPDNYNTNFTLVLPEGVREESDQTQINKTGSFSLVADDPATFTEIRLTATMPWMVGDLRVYKPAAMEADDGKGFQNMIGALIRTTEISRTFRIKKMKDSTSVTVTKAWEDENNKDGIRPASIQVQLLADGKPIGDAVTLSEENGWNTVWKEPAENENGKEVVYTVEEVDVPEGYTVTCSGDEEHGFVLTNQHTPETEDTTIPTTGTSSEETPENPTTPETVTETPPTTTPQTPDVENPQTTASQTPDVENPQTTASQTPDVQNPQTTTSVLATSAKDGVPPTAKENVPSTGDTSHIGLFGLIMVVSAGAAVAILLLRRKNRAPK